MNLQIIKDLIESNNETYPKVTFSNPLLDIEVTRALSKSFIMLLKISNELNTNKKLRYDVLQYIRNLCKIEPDKHLKVDENNTELLVSYYDRLVQNQYQNDIVGTDMKLDAFLIRRTKEISIASSFPSIIKPEVAQALINLDDKVKVDSYLTKNIIHWNPDNMEYLKILKGLWNSDKSHIFYDKKCSNLLDDISIKIKTEIELLFLNIVNDLLRSDSIDIEDILKNSTYKSVIETCIISPECYQICISILNTLFIMNNFHIKVHNLIGVFVQKVKTGCSKSFAVLYPTHLTHLVTLLDFDVNLLPLLLRQDYVQTAINYLKHLQVEIESDLILLLSHFSQWDEFYFN